GFTPDRDSDVEATGEEDARAESRADGDQPPDSDDPIDGGTQADDETAVDGEGAPEDLEGEDAETADDASAADYVLHAEQRDYIEGRHFMPGAEDFPDKTYFTIPREGLDEVTALTLEQDPQGIPNTLGRTGTIHRAEMPESVGDEGYIGRAGAAHGNYPLDHVEVIMNDPNYVTGEHSVRDVYPWNPIYGAEQS
ncbi:hypothetical protein ACFXGY_24150, partial [Streptomyces sp. NPDC059346]